MRVAQHIEQDEEDQRNKQNVNDTQPSKTLKEKEEVAKKVCHGNSREMKLGWNSSPIIRSN